VDQSNPYQVLTNTLKGGFSTNKLYGEAEKYDLSSPNSVLERENKLNQFLLFC